MAISIDIRPATVDQVPLILQFIRDLAEYEKALDEVVVTEDLLKKNLFGDHPKAEAIFAYVTLDNGVESPAAYAVFFHNFSTWTGRAGLYLEDLFVRPEYRGMGIGKRLVAQLAAIAKERDYDRCEWLVLDWNKPTREFYELLGAKPLSEWITHRVEGKSLNDLAEKSRQ